MVVNHETIFKAFFGQIKTDVGTDAKVTVSFIDNVDILPQVIVKKPVLPREPYTMGETGILYKRDGYIDVEVIALTSKEMTELIYTVEESVFDNKTSFGVSRIKMGDSDEARFDVGGKSAHTKLLRFDFQVKTQ